MDDDSVPDTGNGQQENMPLDCTTDVLEEPYESQINEDQNDGEQEMPLDLSPNNSGFFTFLLSMWVIFNRFYLQPKTSRYMYCQAKAAKRQKPKSRENAISQAVMLLQRFLVTNMTRPRKTV